MAKQTEEETEEKPSGGGLMSVLPMAVVAAAASFGMVWVARGEAGVPSEAACEAFVEEEERADMTPEELAELEARAAKYITLEPITVSLGPDANARNLRITLALGIPPELDELTDVEFLRLRDRFLERLRTVDTNLIADPSAMPALKETLLAQARMTLGDDAVYSVLITDFLMK